MNDGKRWILAGAAAALALGAVPLISAPENPAAPASKETIARGETLSYTMGCHDCHSPKVFTPQGPAPDGARLLSGAPNSAKAPPIPAGALGSGWGALCTDDMTTWAGPWGVSFATNLTPDVDTGIGSWTEAMFLKAMHTGKHFGESRDILPPMPWMNIVKAGDDDLRSLFAYLRSVKPIRNAVRDPIPPATPPAGAPAKK